MADQNQFDINAHLNQMGFGQKGSGGGSGSGEGMTFDDLPKKSLDKVVQTVFKLLGTGINPDIDGKSALAGFDAENVGSGLSLSNMSMLKDVRGGVLASILNYFTRELPKMFNGDEGGSSGDYSGGGGGDYNGGGSGSGGDYSSGGGDYYAGAQGGGGDFHGHASFGGGHHGDHDVKVSYGDKLVSAEAMVGDLGQLRPSATPVNNGNDRDYGMGV